RWATAAVSGRGLRRGDLSARSHVLPGAGARAGRVRPRAPGAVPGRGVRHLHAGEGADLGALAEALGRRLPEQGDVLHLSFALSDQAHLAHLMGGTGIMPQAYRALAESERRAVREEVHDRLRQFEVDGRLVMSLEMLIGAG